MKIKLKYVNGKVWAQVNLFANLTVSQINTVCPNGTCVIGGELNGYDMTGWVWATAVDIHALFNFYGVNPPLSITNNYVSGSYNSIWATDFSNGGWHPTESVPESWLLRGWLVSVSAPQEAVIAAMIDNRSGYGNDLAYTQTSGGGAYSYVGAWFYRSQ
jgi:hypothetical protein